MILVRRLIILFLTIGCIVAVYWADFLTPKAKTIALNFFSLALGLQASIFFVKYAASDDN